VPESLLRSKRAIVVAVVATVVGVSAAVMLSGQTTAARAATAPGSTVRASVADAHAEEPTASGGANQELSANGTAVVFSSDAQLDRLSNDGNEAVYVRDLRNDRTIMISRGQFTRPAPPSSSSVPPTTTTTTTTTTTNPPTFEPPRLAGKPLLSLNGRRQQQEPVFGEVAPDGGSTEPTISADGRFVAFVTRAANIVVADDDNSRDLLLCDRDPDGDGQFDEQREDGSLIYRYFRVNEPDWVEGDGFRYRNDAPRVPKLSDSANRIVWQDRVSDDSGFSFTTVLTTPVTQVGPGAIETLAPALGELPPRALTQPDVSADGRFVVMVGDYISQGTEGGFPFQAVIRKDLATHSVARVDWDVNTTPGKPVVLST